MAKNADIQTMFGSIAPGGGEKKRPLKDEEDRNPLNSKRLRTDIVDKPKQSKGTPNAEWLARLSLEDAQALCKVFRNTVLVKEKYHLNLDKATLLSLTAASGDRDGRWYTEHVKCLIADLSTATGQHPRWQVSLMLDLTHGVSN